MILDKRQSPVPPPDDCAEVQVRLADVRLVGLEKVVRPDQTTHYFPALTGSPREGPSTPTPMEWGHYILIPTYNGNRNETEQNALSIRVSAYYHNQVKCLQEC